VQPTPFKNTGFRANQVVTSGANVLWSCYLSWKAAQRSGSTVVSEEAKKIIICMALGCFGGLFCGDVSRFAAAFTGRVVIHNLET